MAPVDVDPVVENPVDMDPVDMDPVDLGPVDVCTQRVDPATPAGSSMTSAPTTGVWVSAGEISKFTCTWMEEASGPWFMWRSYDCRAAASALVAVAPPPLPHFHFKLSQMIWILLSSFSDCWQPNEAPVC